MRKFTLKIQTLIMFLLFGTYVMAQMPAAINMQPTTATAWDEITLIFDASLSCPDSVLFGADSVMIHSGVNIDGSPWQNTVDFDGVGADGTYPKLEKMMFPLAISMTPENGTATDEITITLDVGKSCPAGALLEADSVMMHSGVTLDGSAWQNVVDYDGVGGDGQAPKMTDNGDGTWSFTFIPMDFYSVTAGEVTAINCVFNNGTWDAEGKDTDAEGSCVDFTILLGGMDTYKWMITFTPSEFYGITTDTEVTEINGVFNNGTWDAEGKDFDEELNCVDFVIPFYISAIGENPEVTFKMYPNPTESILNIENLEGANLIEIYNVVGAKVMTVENIFNDAVQINTSKLNTGVYFLNVHSQNGVQTAKFLKN